MKCAEFGVLTCYRIILMEVRSPSVDLIQSFTMIVSVSMSFRLLPKLVLCETQVAAVQHAQPLAMADDASPMVRVVVRCVQKPYSF